MAQTGYTPISLYYSTTASTAPTAGNLVAGELAINTTDGILYYKDTAGVVQKIGTKGGVGSTTSGQALFNNSGVIGGSNSFFWDITNSRLGIGTNTPGNPLTVSTNANSQQWVQVLNTNAGSSATGGLLFGNDASGAISTIFTGSSTYGSYGGANSLNLGTFSSGPITFITSNTERMRIDSSGNVGIGTSSPQVVSSQTRLTVNGSGASGYVLYVGGTNTANYVASSGAAYLGSVTGIPLIFSTTDTERMRIDSSGNLLVGTTSQTGRLTVRATGNTSSDWSLSTASNGGTAQLRVRGDGALYLGLDTVSPYNLTTANSANAYLASDGYLQRSTSSIKYKTDVQDATHGLAEVLKLRPVTYKGKNDGDTVFGGLIAEEVDEIGLTEFVQYAKDGTPDALAYGQMVSLAFKAIQELKAEIDALKGAK